MVALMTNKSSGLPGVPRGSSPESEPRWAWVVGALLLLAMIAGFFQWASVDLSAARQELGAAQQRLSEARQEEVRTIELAKRAQLALGLMRDAANSGLGHTAWAERRFNIKQATMSRAAANSGAWGTSRCTSCPFPACWSHRPAWPFWPSTWPS